MFIETVEFAILLAFRSLRCVIYVFTFLVVLLVLDKFGSELLSRGPGMVVPGEWCIGNKENGTDPCLVTGDPTIVRPTPCADRLEKLISSLMSAEHFRPRLCK